MPRDLLTVAQPQTLSRSRSRALPARRAWAVVLAVAVAAAIVRGWLAFRIPIPWIMTDELIYRELATSFAYGGHFLVRGEHIGLVSLYPVVIAPFWRSSSVAVSLDLSRVLNVIAMTAGSLLVFAWARRLVSDRYAAVAFGLSLLMPAYLYTSELMSENLAMPAFILAAFSIWRALERPTVARQAGALGAVVLVCAIRLQGVALFAIWPTAIVLYAVLATDRGKRARSVRATLRSYWPSALALAVVAGGYLLLTAARGKNPLGFYESATGASYSAVRLAQWFAYHLAELSLAVGLIPAAALLMMMGAALRRRADPAVAALLAVAFSSVVWLAAVAGTWASWHADGIRERYDIYAVPLLLIVFAVFLERAKRSLMSALAAGAVACLTPLALPLTSLLTFGVASKAPSLDGFRWLADQSQDVWPYFIGFAVAAVALLLLGRRPGAVAWTAFVAVVFLLNTIAGSALAESLTTRIKSRAHVSSWVDDRIGSDARAGIVWTGSVDPNWLWQVEFWNRSIRRVYFVHEREPGDLPNLQLVVGSRGELRADGRPLAVRALVSDRTFAIDGRVLASQTSGLSLFRVTPKTTVGAVITGLYSDSWTGRELTYTVPACRGLVPLGFAFRAWPVAPPQIVTARQGSTVVGRVHTVPGKRVFLRAPLDASKGACTLRLTIAPTWVPAEVTGSSDTRQLGLVFEKAFRLL